MLRNSFISIFKKSFQDLLKNPLLTLTLVPSFIILFLLGNLSLVISAKLTTNTLQVVWLIVYTLLSLMILAVSFTILIRFCAKTQSKNKISVFEKLPKNAFRNFVAILGITLVSSIIFFISRGLGKLLIPLNPKLGLLVFIITMFIGLAGGLIFLTFTPFIAVLKKESFIQVIRNSILIVKINYILIISIIVLYLILMKILSFLPSIGLELIQTLILTPYLALIFTRVLTENDIHTG